jgi:tetratricopeptide (TPR) repeat protein
MFDWGTKQALARFGYFAVKEGDLLYNLAGLFGIAMRSTGTVYRDFTSPAFDALKLPLFIGYSGFIKSISNTMPPESPEIYGLYSFRGLFSGHARSEENMEIVMRYLIYMSMHAEKLLLIGRDTEAIGLYKKVLLIPAPKMVYNIYYRIAQAYEGINDNARAIVYFKKAIHEKNDFDGAYRAAGAVYYKTHDIYNAVRMFELSIKYGAGDAGLREFIEAQRGMIGKNEEVLAGADEAAQAKDYVKAADIYRSMIRTGYRASELFLKLGLMYYEAGMNEKALMCFKSSNDIEPNAKAYFYSAAVYNDKGLRKEALSALSGARVLFKDDPDLERMQLQLMK